MDVNYTSLVTNIINKKHILSLNEVFTRMKTHEIQIQRMNLPNPHLIQANYTRTCSSRSAHQQPRGNLQHSTFSNSSDYSSSRSSNQIKNKTPNYS